MNTNSYLLALKIALVATFLVSAETNAEEVNCVATASESTSPLYPLRRMTATGPSVVAVGSNILVARTSNGQWRITKFGHKTAFFNDIIWDGKQYLAVYKGRGIFLSPDGMTWTQRHDVFPPYLGDSELSVGHIAYGNSQYVASSYGYSQGRSWLTTSADGINWEIAKFPFPLSGMTSIIWDGRKFLTGTGLMSTNGINWSLSADAPSQKPVTFTDLTWNGESYIGVRLNGAIWHSADGKTWSLQELSLKEPHRLLNGITWGQSQFVVVGSCGNVITSKDGQTWVRRDSGTKMNLLDVAWTGKEFIAVGEARADKYSQKQSVGIILMSPNGIDWKRVPDDAFVQQ